MDYIVQEAEAGRHLRSILRGSMGISYSAVKSAKWENRILRNGVPTPVDAIVQAGDRISFLQAETAPAYLPKPYDLPVDILWEDKYLMVLNKPAGIASQSSLNHPDNTMENALFAHMGCPENFVYRPVNRLDRGTSGIMVVARDAHTQHLLQQLLHTKNFAREYLAIVEGTLPDIAGTISAPIGKEDAASVRRIISPDGKPSVTHYQVLETHGTLSLVRLRLETGRTHQIRVHMAHMGCPVFGDFLYGKESPQLPCRFALHSWQLTLRHPCTGEILCIQAPLPEALQDLLKTADKEENL